MNISELRDSTRLSEFGLTVAADGEIMYPSFATDAAIGLCNTYLNTNSLTAAIPQRVTMRQARLALLNTGLLQTVNAAVASMAGIDGDAARIEWEFSSEVHRHKSLTTSLGTSLGMSSAQLDALFVAAALL